MKSAVLFLVFNRPGITRQVFEAIRAAQPPRLYVAADGPRSDHEGEREHCAEVRRIASRADWPCAVKTLFRDENLGCKLAVSEAINWFFDNEEEGIIIEDDVLPLPSFFPYCDELLEKYREDERVTMVSGCNFISNKFSPTESYLFTHNMHIWSWASWRRAWRHYDVAMSSWPQWRDHGGLSRKFPNDRLISSYWRDIYDSVQRGKIDTWDYQWHYACWRFGGLCVLPSHNLTRNLGFGPEATHTSAAITHNLILPTPRETAFPLVHPKIVEPNETADILISKNIYSISVQTATRRWLRRIPVVGDILGKMKGMLNV